MTNRAEQYSHHDSVSHRPYTRSTIPDTTNVPQGLTPQGLTPQDPYFDFSTFALPSEYGLPEGSDHWFSLDFYSALQETDWEQMLGLGDQSLSTLPEGAACGMDADASLHNEGQLLQPREVHYDEGEQHHDKINEEGVEDESHALGRISRLSSPPNEASLEDRTPFAWNPRSRRIAEAKEIVLSPQDPLLKFHEPRYDITEPTYQRVKKFLIPHGHALASSVQDSFTIPALPITNAFIAKFFQRFAPQAPVLHTPTLNTNADLPPALLAVIVVIGAIYSRLRHTRRFAILALDRVRRNLLLAIEDDNTLMRDHMTIYAVALVCYTGLWCGNKRAFELAEILRGAMITYVRRTGSAETSHISTLGPQTNTPCMTNLPKSLQSETLKTQWHRWVIHESRNRLFWFVYTIDCHFPSLLNMPPLMSPTEVSGWDCPCDEEFWISRSARHWKSLLGSASMPSSRSFAAAIAPFALTHRTCSSLDRENSDYRSESQISPLNLNAWSYFLVIMTLQGRIFQHAEERLLARKLLLATSHGDSSDEEDSDHPTQPRDADAPTKQDHPLASALNLWASTYTAQLPPPHQSDPTSLYFHHASAVLSRLSRIHLDVPITDLQEAIGKGGNAMIQPAISRLATWVSVDPTRAKETVVEAVDTIQRILWFQQTRTRKTDESAGGGEGSDTSPYNSITLFLSYVLLWGFATVATAEQRREVGDLLAGRGEEFRSRSLQRVVRIALGVPAEPQAGTSAAGGEETAGPKVLFKHAAQVLTRLGDWGCSLNLALLLHWRSEM